MNAWQRFARTSTTVRGAARMVAFLILLSLLLVPSVVVAAPTHASGGLTLTLTGDSPATVALSWTPPAGSSLLFVNYEVDRSTASTNGPWTSVASITNFAATSRYQDGLSPWTHYWWRVVMNESSFGPVTSNVVSVIQPGPAVLAVDLVGSASANLSWTNSASYGGGVAFVSYTVAESLDNASFANVSVLTSASELATTISGLRPESSYAFELRTADGCGQAANCAAFPSPSVTTSNAVRRDTPMPLTATVVAAPVTLAQGAHGSFSCVATGGNSPRVYVWSFGDGSTAPGRNVTHSFSQPGAYTVVCQVRDGVGNRANATANLTVTATTPSGSNGTGNPGGSNGGGGSGGGGTPLRSATSSTQFGLIATAVLAIAVIVAVTWLVLFLGRRRGRSSPRPTAGGPTTGAMGEPENPPGRTGEPEEAPTPPPTDPSAERAGPVDPPRPRDFDELFDQLDGVRPG
jgi:hypothetical protein